MRINADVRVDSRQFARLLGKLERGVPRAIVSFLEELGRQIIAENVDAALTDTGRAAWGAAGRETKKSGRNVVVSGTAGYSYDRSRLPLNQPRTLARKLRKGSKRRGGLLFSLLDSGILLDKTRYKRTSAVSKRRMTGEIRVSVPDDRRLVVGYLAEKGYKYFGIPALIQGEPAHTYAEALLQRYVEEALAQGGP